MGKYDWVLVGCALLFLVTLGWVLDWEQSRYSRGYKTVSGHHLELISKTRRSKHHSELVFIDHDWFCQEIRARYVNGYPEEINIQVGDTLKLMYTVESVYKDKKHIYDLFEIDKENVSPYYEGN